MKKNYYIHTPLLLSHPLSQLVGRNIYLKYEALQPSGSFKDRGIGALCQYYAKLKVAGFVSSSGGNAGMAVAYASKMLNIPATIIVPNITPDIVVKKLAKEGSTVIVEGDNWNSADRLAKEMASAQQLAYIPPFDHPIIWQGYVSIIKEIQQDGLKPDAIIVSVGGGGLFTGLIQGLHQLHWEHVPIITAETQGAASLATAFQLQQRITLDKIETVAGTLGAKQICSEAFNWLSNHPVLPQIVTDKEAVSACLRFANDQRLLVEPATGASLAIVYTQREILDEFKNIVVIVCGGSGVNLDLLQKWQREFGL